MRVLDEAYTCFSSNSERAGISGLPYHAAAVVKAVDNGEDVNEVEAAGNTPLHHAAFEGWVTGAELLLSLGAHIDASNNAGDRPWHWARNMGHEHMIKMLEQVIVHAIN